MKQHPKCLHTVQSDLQLSQLQRGRASYIPSHLLSCTVSYYGTAFNASSYLKIDLLLTVLHYTVYSETLDHVLLTAQHLQSSVKLLLALSTVHNHVVNYHGSRSSSFMICIVHNNDVNTAWTAWSSHYSSII